MDLTPEEQRVLGCLLEKQRTTPDQYPLTLNSLRLACNQSTNRDPVVDYDEPQIRAALERLRRRRWVRLASGHGSRAAKYRHLLAEELALSPEEQALLAVLLLRGPQTPGELKTRSERLAPLPDLAAIGEVLERLASRGLARALGRRPGQKEERWQHALAGEEPIELADLPPYQERTPPPSAAYAATTPDAELARAGSLAGRVAALEAQIRELRNDLDALLARLERDGA